MVVLIVFRYLYSGDIPKAMEHAGAVKRFSSERGDTRWHCNALIVLSRIARARGKYTGIESAQSYATEALEKATERGQPFGRIDALIARGEAQAAGGDYTGAQIDFEQSLKEGKSNPKVSAVCHLHLARASLQGHDWKRARKHFEAWENVKNEIESAWVQEFGAAVGVELTQATNDLVFGWSEAKGTGH